MKASVHALLHTCIHYTLLFFFVVLGIYSANAQIYFNNFGTTTITGATYTGTPTIDGDYTSSAWTNSVGNFTSFSGSGGAPSQALALSNSSGTPTITLSIGADPCAITTITSISLWQQRSATGAQNISITANGQPVGGVTAVPTTGAVSTFTPMTPLCLSGPVTIVLSLSGASGTGTFRFDNFTINGTAVVTNVSAVAFSNVSACNNNSTPAITTDDYFTADVTVTYVNPPCSGTLDLTGDVVTGGGASSVAVGSLASATSHTFTGVRFSADGTSTNVTAAFSQVPTCFSSLVGPTVGNCSMPSCTITALTVVPGACNNNGTPADITDDYYTADVTVTYTTPPALGNLVLSGTGLHPTNAVTTVASPFTTTSTFTGVRIRANGAVASLTATFSADAACTFTNPNIAAVTTCSVLPCTPNSGTFPN
ncbi:MAG: hypothetical protein WAS72_12695 [Saprospiraceae bacterium]